MERIKAERSAEEERKQARMRELAEEARERREAQAADERKREAEWNAKLRTLRRSSGEPQRSERSASCTTLGWRRGERLRSLKRNGRP